MSHKGEAQVTTKDDDVVRVIVTEAMDRVQAVDGFIMMSPKSLKVNIDDAPRLNRFPQ
jgi:hypothetical protein